MKKLFLFSLIIFSIPSFSQKLSKAKPFAKTITSTDLKKHLYIVAGAEMEGRETATEGQRKAAAYIENEFKRIGLQPGNGESYLQYFPIFQDSLLNATLEINGQPFQLEKDFKLNINNNISATMRFGEVVVIGQNALDSLQNTDVTGKLILIFGEAPSAASRNNPLANSRFTAIRNKGAAAILMVNAATSTSMVQNRKGAPTLNGFKKVIQPQQVTISESVAKAILGQNWEAAKNASSSIQNYNTEVLLEVNKNTSTVQSSNVIGVLPGTDLKDEYLFITAHYDHLGIHDGVIHYGADDDGSGTVSVIELAEAFAKAKARGNGPRRSIVFMTVSGEEKGLWGSEYYAAHPIFPLAKTTADLNIDMVGRIDPKRTYGDSTNYIYVVGDDKLSSDLRSISEAVNKKYSKLELDYKYNDPNDKEFIYYRSDHFNFAKSGVPIIFYFNGTHADYHQPTDTPDKINYDLMEKRARFVFFTAWEIANKDALLKRDIPLQIPSYFR